MSARAVASAGSGPELLARGRANAASHPHAALLVAVAATLATEPAVQAGRDAASNLEYAGAGLGLAARAAIALACLFVAWEGQRRLRLAPVLGCSALLGAGWLVLHLLTGVDPSLAMFVLAIGTAWLAVRAAQPHAEAVPT